MNDHIAPKTPWHLWVVGGLGLLWNAVGVFGYVMAQTGNLKSLDMTVDQIAYFDSFPAWADAAWALGVWGTLLGSLLLLLKSRWAVTSFWISLVGLIGTTIFQRFVTVIPAELDNIGLSVLIWVTTFLLLFYSIRMRKQGMLR
ncbi:MAG: hypothetical protein V3V15_04135 [Sphingorhabdus sp.]